MVLISVRLLKKKNDSNYNLSFAKKKIWKIFEMYRCISLLHLFHFDVLKCSVSIHVLPCIWLTSIEEKPFDANYISWQVVIGKKGFAEYEFK